MHLNASLLPCTGLTQPPLCYSPQQIRKAYDIEPLIDQGVTGKGQTIVLVDDYQNPSIVSDLRLFDLIFNLNDPKLRIIAPQGLKPFDASDSAAIGFADEIALDVEWAHAIAPGATIDLVLGNPVTSTLRGQVDALIDATDYAVEHQLGSVISLSVGTGETCYSSSEISRWHHVFILAQQRAISVLVASGDSGAAAVQCNREGKAIQDIRGVNYPASDPLVTAVGGTTLLVNHSGHYKYETVWDDELNGLGSGGGMSSLFTRPDYQTDSVTRSTQRALPDVSYDADPNTGVPVVLTGSSITLIVPIGGTSAGAPQWAALVALVEQAIGRSLGFLNPYLYHLGEGKAFHDITIGNNTVMGVNKQLNPITIQGYQAQPGWNPATGWGSPDVSSLIQLI